MPRQQRAPIGLLRCETDTSFARVCLREQFRDGHEDYSDNAEEDSLLVLRAWELAVRHNVRANPRLHIPVAEPHLSKPRLGSAGHRAWRRDRTGRPDQSRTSNKSLSGPARTLSEHFAHRKG